MTPWSLVLITGRMELSLIEMGKTVGGTGLGLSFVHVGCEMPIESQVSVVVS